MFTFLSNLSRRWPELLFWLSLFFILLFCYGTWKAEAMDKTNRRDKSFPTCILVVSGSEYGWDIEFEHENAHCWGWEHVDNDPFSVIPPASFSIRVLGVYPNIMWPLGKTATRQEALIACGGHSACARTIR